MGAKRYLKDQFKFEKFGFQHEDASDFYLSCWQNNRSPFPLFCFRLILFLGCIGILVTSLILIGQERRLGYWAIYMTQWGVVMLVVASGLGFLVSARAYFYGPIDSTFGLPWYLKLYWSFYNIGITVAFFVTVLYYPFLYSQAIDYAVDPVLDLFVHGINSVAMFALLVSSRQPSYFLHVVYSFVFVFIYLIFNIIYFYAGDITPLGERWIYPMLDWEQPGTAIGFVFAFLAILLLIQASTVIISLLRDFVMRRYVQKINSVSFTT